MKKQDIENQNEVTNNLIQDQYLTFCIGEESFGIDIEIVHEIKAWSRPTRLPNASEFLLGVLNVRGAILPIFDLKNRFGMGSTDCNNRKVILFINHQHSMLGILVDGVSDIINAPKTAVKPAPKMNGRLRDEFIKGLLDIEHRMLTLLELDKIFEDIDFNKLQAEGQMQKIAS